MRSQASSDLGQSPFSSRSWAPATAVFNKSCRVGPGGGVAGAGVTGIGVAGIGVATGVLSTTIGLVPPAVLVAVESPLDAPCADGVVVSVGAGAGCRK